MNSNRKVKQIIQQGSYDIQADSNVIPRRRRRRSFTSSFQLLGCGVTFLTLSCSFATASQDENIHLPRTQRRLDTVVYVDPAGNLTNASVLPNANYSSFFDDDSVTTHKKPVSKYIPLPLFTITLKLGSANVSSYNDVSSDLDNTMTSYLLEQVINRTANMASSTTVTDLSLDILPLFRRYLKRFQLPSSLRMTIQSSSLSFQGNGTVSVISPTNVFQTDNTAITQSVESSLSDSTALLAYITSHASTTLLKDILGLSTSFNGQVYTSTVSNSVLDNTTKPSRISVKRIVCQIFGYALIAIAAMSAFGWMYLFYLRYEAQKEDTALFRKASRFKQKKKDTNTKTDTTDTSFDSYPMMIPKRTCTMNSLQVSRNTTHEELSDESYRDDSLVGGDHDDDSFGMKLQKAILLDQSSGHHAVTVKAEKSQPPSKQSDPIMMKPFIPTLKPPPRQGSTSRIMYTLSKSSKGLFEEENIPDPVDLELASDNSSSSSSEFGEESPIGYFQISTQSSSQYVKLILDSPERNKSESPVLDFAFKPRPATSTVERMISKDEYDAAVDAAAFQIKQVSSNTPRASNKDLNYTVHEQSVDEKPNHVRDYLVSKLSSLINKLDPTDPAENDAMKELVLEKKSSNVNDDFMSDNDTEDRTVSTSGPSIGNDPNRRLGIHPIGSKHATFQPPPSITMKRILRDISKPETGQLASTVPSDADRATVQTIPAKAQNIMNSSVQSVKQKISERSIESKEMKSIANSSTSSVSASESQEDLHTQHKGEKSIIKPSSSLISKIESHVSTNHEAQDQLFKTNIQTVSHGMPSTVLHSEESKVIQTHQISNTDPIRKTVAVSTKSETVSKQINKNVWKNKSDAVHRNESPQSIPQKKDVNVKVNSSERSLIDYSSNVLPTALRSNTPRSIPTPPTMNGEKHSLEITDSRQVPSEEKKSIINNDPQSASNLPIGKSPKRPTSEVSLYAIHDLVSPSSIIQQSSVRPSAVKAAAESLKRPQSRFKDPKSWMFAMDITDEPRVSNVITPSPQTPSRKPSPTTITLNRPKSPVYAATPPQIASQMDGRMNASKGELRVGATKLIEKFEKG